VPILNNGNFGFLPRYASSSNSKILKLKSLSFGFMLLQYPHRRADRAPEKLLKQELDLSEQREFSSSQQL
jgi:hypothetical protein